MEQNKTIIITLFLISIAHVNFFAQNWSTTSNNYTTGHLGVGTQQLGISGTAINTLVVGDADRSEGIVINAKEDKDAILAFAKNYVLDARFRYKNSVGELVFENSGQQLWSISKNGNLGINVNSPSEKIDVDGNIRLRNSGNKIYWNWPDRKIDQYSKVSGSYMIRFMNSMGTGNPEGGFNFVDNGGRSVMRINDYKVGIGTETMGNHKLAVNGSVGAREITVEIVDWPDYVFYEDYTLNSLEQIENFVKKNHHLEGVPSKEDIKNSGIKLGEMNAILLKKIEELTLLLIKEHKRNDELARKIEDLNNLLH
ncbi:hypothetical protein [Zunongwangia pacifica]|uniref:Uncharacterized protein n=1 Tax=Zunongwangia pacifica TaxID=2911062 RepID=A0A9X2CM46_9FLAO|nr:hypothetical protein [Zunongwangia pacifica]MCL6220756.1 hypothetical protein [Zunongwangia pacifica]